jgi:hypothetical protein
VGAGRLVWLAAGPHELAGAGDAAVPGDVRRLFAAAYAWAAHEPFAELRLAPTRAEPDAEGWARLREQVAVRVERTGPRRNLLEVSNRSGEPQAGLLLRVYLNTASHAVEVGRTTLQQEEPQPIFDWDANHFDLRLPELPAGGSRAFTLDVEPLGEAGRAARAPG